jgi:hypothetical protein
LQCAGLRQSPQKGSYPMFARFEWTRLPRPVIPLDDAVAFSLT